jgi:putative membrane protein
MHALTVVLLGTTAALYALGLRRLWGKAGRGRGIRRTEAACFAAGWLVVALALLSPLHHLAEAQVWAHMVQHELLMVVAAPLVVLGRPLEAWSWVAPFRVPRILSDPFFAWALHALALWAWHLPALFLAAVTHEGLHLVQHTSFFLPAAIFWWTVFAGKPLAGMASLFSTMLHTGALGFLMAFSRTPWYAGYTLADQQLAGLIMWIPAGTAYPIAALLLVLRLLRRCTA